ncbi:M43 family zinc metalloprotease [Crocinitomix algicola]|nr:M43 family zinc metalloprotease [Crocinitomix algicola]
MRKNYLFLTLFGLFSMHGFSQIKLGNPGTLKSASAIHAGSIISFYNYSPDLTGLHDHEPCLSDQITQDWVSKAGIAEKYQEEKLEQEEMVRRYDGGDRATYTIPVIFHVVYNTPEENVSAEAINDLLDAVNEDFSATNPDVGDARGGYGFIPADVDIEFCMAKQDEVGMPLDEFGIHRVETTETWFNPDTETNKMKSSVDGGTGTEPWDRDDYLNIWICDITNGAMAGVAGYAYKPTVGSLPPAFIDGIVIDYNLGITPSAHILSHEIGHFLGLDHPWGDGGGSCFEDDGLDDTPNTAGPSFDFAGTCSGDQETCAGTQTQYENFMDYANCTVMFTEDQKTLMHSILEYSRAPLAASTMCEPAVPVAPVADFEADVTSVIVGGSVNFTDLSDNYPTSWLWTVSPDAGVTFIGGTSETSENPVVQFAETGFYTISLVATNAVGSDTETKTDYIEVIDGGIETAYCDTSRNYTALEFENAAFYTLEDEVGYYPAQVTLAEGVLRANGYAERFNAPIATLVHKLRIPFIQIDDIGAPSDVTFYIYEDDAGQPGTVLASQVRSYSDLDEGFFNEIAFPGGVSVFGDYWVGLEYDYSGGFDTLLMLTTNFADRPPGASTTSVLVSGLTGWTLTSDLFGGMPNGSLIIDVLTSLGTAPEAIVAWPDAETCEGNEVTMNGSGSLNTTDYYWNISDGFDDYYFDEANLTATFDPGLWTISLTAIGSCQSDESESFVLSVNESLTVTSSTEPENCGAEDGEINFSVDGGDGGPYDYSINDGATFFPTSSFTDLSAGTYSFVVRDEANCETSGDVVVDAVISFSPVISPDITIEEGESTVLTVSGGVSWMWYTGADFVGDEASITVSPETTTTYTCFVTDAEGCEIELEVTVSVGAVGIEVLGFDNFVEVYPNPTNDYVNIGFNLSEERSVQLKIINLVGAVVLEDEFKDVKDNTIGYDVSNYASGLYYIVLQSEDLVYTHKLIIR